MKIKKSFILCSILLIAMLTFSNNSIAQYRTYNQIDAELTNAGYSESTVPSSCSLDYSGGDVHFYTQSGLTPVWVYHWNSEEEIPQSASEDCTQQAHAEYDPDTQKTTEICAGPGNECKNAVKTDPCGNNPTVVIICCN